MYSDADAAALYDVTNGWDGAKWPSDAFYTDLVMDADSVLDVGCGTGSMLGHVRESGHTGRLVGLDPDAAMLDRARRRTDIEWVLAKAEDAAWDREFALATMTSHAFQFLATDAEIRASLTAIRNALVDGGRFAFETRNPAARAWDAWGSGDGQDVVDHDGRTVRVWHRIESEADDVIEVVELTDCFDGDEPRADRATMRFLDPARLNAFLTDAGFSIVAQSGDWTGAPITEQSPEIVTIAQRV
jgi:SAM-dependent methyltransferase